MFLMSCLSTKTKIFTTGKYGVLDVVRKANMGRTKVKLLFSSAKGGENA